MGFRTFFTLIAALYSLTAAATLSCPDLLSFLPAGQPEVLSEETIQHRPELMATQAPLPATQYVLKFKNGHQVDLIDASTDSVPRLQKREKIRAMLADLPDLHVGAVRHIEILPGANREDEFWKEFYRSRGNFTSSVAAAADHRIHFFNNARIGNESQLIRENLFHEFGHLVAKRCFDSVKPPADWIRIAEKEAVVSSYADVSWAEDFAESVALYLMAKPGSTHESAREMYPLRFQYLDRLFAKRPPSLQNDLREWITQNKELSTALVFGVGVAGGTAVVYYYKDDLMKIIPVSSPQK